MWLGPSLMCLSTPAALGYSLHVKRQLRTGTSVTAFTLATLAAGALVVQIAAILVTECT